MTTSFEKTTTNKINQAGAKVVASLMSRSSLLRYLRSLTEDARGKDLTTRGTASPPTSPLSMITGEMQRSRQQECPSRAEPQRRASTPHFFRCGQSCPSWKLSGPGPCSHAWFGGAYNLGTHARKRVLPVFQATSPAVQGLFPIFLLMPDLALANRARFQQFELLFHHVGPA